MNPTDFKALRKKACELHATQPAADKQKISLDAVFIALSAIELKTRRRDIHRVSEDTPPDWFVDTLKKLKGTGEKVTVSRFLLLAGQFPATRADALNTGRWLREAKITPKKVGGNLIFEL